MKFAIADPPYLGRAVRWYGVGGCGVGYGQGQADQHPEAAVWDLPQTHIQLVEDLQRDYDGWAIAMSVHSLSVYLSAVETDSRNGIRVGVWHKPAAVTSGSRVTNCWEPVLFKIPQDRRGWKSGTASRDVFTFNPPKSGFMGAKPKEWVQWVVEVLGVTEQDSVEDLFYGSGAVTQALMERPLF